MHKVVVQVGRAAVYYIMFFIGNINSFNAAINGHTQALIEECIITIATYSTTQYLTAFQ